MGLELTELLDTSLVPTITIITLVPNSVVPVGGTMRVRWSILMHHSMRNIVIMFGMVTSLRGRTVK